MSPECISSYDADEEKNKLGNVKLPGSVKDISLLEKLKNIRVRRGSLSSLYFQLGR